MLHPALALSHEGQFAQRETVHHGDGQRTHTAVQAVFQDGAIGIVTRRIGAVEHHHLPARLSAAVHQPQHTDIIGVEAQSYILYVNHQHVEVMHDGIARPRAASVVERAYGDACGLVHRTAHVLAGIGGTAETVFGTKQRGHPYATGKQAVQRMQAVAIHSRLVAEERHAPAAEQWQIERIALAAQKQAGGGMTQPCSGWHYDGKHE